jgi:hypothetical protein
MLKSDRIAGDPIQYLFPGTYGSTTIEENGDFELEEVFPFVAS